MQCEDTRGDKMERAHKGMSSHGWLLTGILKLLWKKRKRSARPEGIEFAKAGMFREEDKFWVAGGKGLWGRV